MPAVPGANAPSAATPYCYDGCQMPYPNTSLADPFSEFGLQGFKGQAFCNITCSSPLSAFAGGLLPAACSNQSIAGLVGAQLSRALQPGRLGGRARVPRPWQRPPASGELGGRGVGLLDHRV